jgi:hypothetical protein
MRSKVMGAKVGLWSLVVHGVICGSRTGNGPGLFYGRHGYLTGGVD